MSGATVLLLVLMAMSPIGCAEEPPYTLSTAADYLNNKTSVVVVLRIDGGVSSGEFSVLLEELGSVTTVGDTSSVVSRWEHEVDVFPQHRLVILKSLKGSSAGTFTIPATTPGAYLLPLGKPVLAFLDSRVDYISTCDVFDVSLLAPEILAEGNLDRIIDAIVSERLSLCTRIEE